MQRIDSRDEEDDKDGPGSPTLSSDNDQDEAMEDVEDGEGDGEGDNEGGDDDNEDDNDENEDENDDADVQTKKRPAAGTVTQDIKTPPGQTDSGEPSSEKQLKQNGDARSPTADGEQQTQEPQEPLSPVYPRPKIRLEATTAATYDIGPVIAAPQSTSINCITAVPDMRWIFTGGSDGYIRKFNWTDTVNGKLMLTVQQRAPFVDSIVKAGVLLSYWESDEVGRGDGDNFSPYPVYSLAVQSYGLWLLSGLENGVINLQSIRHDEGKRIAALRKHKSAVSVLTLAPDEKSLLSGSWDKTILDWDLNTGEPRRSFDGSTGQVSTIAWRPISDLPLPDDTEDATITSGTISSNNADQPKTNGIFENPLDEDASGEPDIMDFGEADGQGSPVSDLFGDGDNDSVFGGNDTSLENGNVFGADDTDFTRVLAGGEEDTPLMPDADGDVSMNDNAPTAPTESQSLATASTVESTNHALDPASALSVKREDEPLTNGLPHSAELSAKRSIPLVSEPRESVQYSDTTFLSTTINGIIRIWDVRQRDPVSIIQPQNCPPWCMSACWSPDGNFIYAGRRNGTIDEYNLHKSLRRPERTFKLPHDSGRVTSLKPMPNGRHLVCASTDIVRLYDLKEDLTKTRSAVPFLIVPGHRGGSVSEVFFDPTCSYMITIAGNRGWEGHSTEVLLGYEVNCIQE